MGIKGLFAYVRSLNPNIVSKFELKQLAGWKLAVDVAFMCYQYKSGYITKAVERLDLLTQEINQDDATMVMIKGILTAVDKILIAHVCPIIVFDGQAPDLKGATKTDRRRKAQKTQDSVGRLKHIGNGILGNIPGFQLTEDDYAFLKNRKKPITDIGTLRDRLLTDTKSCIVITPLEHTKLRAIFDAIGLPNLVADDEAEKTCAIMAYNRDVVAAYTVDSDALLYCCPITITKLTFPEYATVPRPPSAEAYCFIDALGTTNLPIRAWKDFCIMNGTDFNKNSPKCGAITNHDLIHTYGDIAGMKAAKAFLEERSLSQPWVKLAKIEKQLMAYQFEILNYEEVLTFINKPVSYDRSVMHIKPKEATFDESIPALRALLGDRLLDCILPSCRSIMKKLANVAPGMRH